MLIPSWTWLPSALGKIEIFYQLVYTAENTIMIITQKNFCNISLATK
jgi:hypothetical protein